MINAKSKAAFVVFCAWFALISSSQLLRGNPIAPAKMEHSEFWTIHICIALLLAACAYVVTALVQLLSGVNK